MCFHAVRSQWLILDRVDCTKLAALVMDLCPRNALKGPHHYRSQKSVCKVRESGDRSAKKHVDFVRVESQKWFHLRGALTCQMQ